MKKYFIKGTDQEVEILNWVVGNSNEPMTAIVQDIDTGEIFNVREFSLNIKR